MTRTIVAVLLVVVPVLFTLFYGLLAKAFSYPGILREPAVEVLERFAAGGTRLRLLWWAFAMSALAFVPIAVGLGSLLGTGTLASATVTVGALAALVQVLGLIRWPFLVPLLARERERSPQTVDLLFDVVNRYLGVAVGEHLGYLLTGSWTILVSVSLLGTGMLPAWFAVVGIVVGTALLFGALEFVGPVEEKGWALAGTVVAISYTAWALWLIAGGVLLLVL